MRRFSRGIGRELPRAARPAEGLEQFAAEALLNGAVQFGGGKDVRTLSLGDAAGGNEEARERFGGDVRLAVDRGPGVVGCKSSVAPGQFAPRTTPIEITCKLRNMPPKTKAAVTFRLAVSFDTSVSYAAISYAREVFASADDPKQNNTFSNTILLCHVSNESPDCANAK